MINSSKATFAPVQPNEPTLILAMLEVEPSLENIIDGLIRTQSVRRVVAPARFAEAPTEWSDLEDRIFEILADYPSVDAQEADDKEQLVRSRRPAGEDRLEAMLRASIEADRRRLASLRVAPPRGPAATEASPSRRPLTLDRALTG